MSPERFKFGFDSEQYNEQYQKVYETVTRRVPGNPAYLIEGPALSGKSTMMLQLQRQLTSEGHLAHLILVGKTEVRGRYVSRYPDGVSVAHPRPNFLFGPDYAYEMYLSLCEYFFPRLDPQQLDSKYYQDLLAHPPPSVNEVNKEIDRVVHDYYSRMDYAFEMSRPRGILRTIDQAAAAEYQSLRSGSEKDKYEKKMEELNFELRHHEHLEMEYQKVRNAIDILETIKKNPKKTKELIGIYEAAKIVVPYCEFEKPIPSLPSYIMIDSYDEIPDRSRERVGEVLSLFSQIYGGTVIIVTTRPHQIYSISSLMYPDQILKIG